MAASDPLVIMLLLLLLLLPWLFRRN